MKKLVTQNVQIGNADRWLWPSCFAPELKAISCPKPNRKHLAPPNSNNLTATHSPHRFASIPSGGFVSTGFFPTSSQFVLSAVPLLSW